MSEPMNESRWVASREYKLRYADPQRDSTVVAYLWPPRLDNSPKAVPGTWRCRLRLCEIGRADRSHDAFGIDAIQAMRSAMHILHAWLDSMPSEREGATHIEWAGGPGSGLPALD